MLQSFLRFVVLAFVFHAGSAVAADSGARQGDHGCC